MLESLFFGRSRDCSPLICYDFKFTLTATRCKLAVAITLEPARGSIHAESKAKFKAHLTYNDTSETCPSGFDFEGLVALVYFKFEAKNDDKSNEEENGTESNQENEEAPKKIPILGGFIGPKFELFNAST